MIGRRKRPVPGGKIEKPEDKAWNDWFTKLDAKEHEKYLKQLGLDEEEIEEWGQAEEMKPEKQELESKKKPKQ